LSSREPFLLGVPAEYCDVSGVELGRSARGKPALARGAEDEGMALAPDEPQARGLLGDVAVPQPQTKLATKRLCRGGDVMDAMPISETPRSSSAENEPVRRGFRRGLGGR